MAIALTLKNKVVKIAHRYLRSHAEIGRLAGLDHPSAPTLARAFRTALDSELSPDERRWVEDIEALRRRLNRSREPMEMVDYGAGLDREGLTEAEMRAGRRFQTTVGRLAGTGSKAPKWCRMLLKLVREFKPESCLELGTCLGVSAAYQAAALALNGSGKMTTIEGAPELAKEAEKNLVSLGLLRVDVRAGRFDDTLGGVLEEVAPLDYVFIDGHHDEAATVRYFERIGPHLAREAILVFDDIRWSTGMLRAWDRIGADDRVTIAVDLFNLGVAVVGPAGARTGRYTISFG